MIDAGEYDDFFDKDGGDDNFFDGQVCSLIWGLFITVTNSNMERIVPTPNSQCSDDCQTVLILNQCLRI